MTPEQLAAFDMVTDMMTEKRQLFFALRQMADDALERNQFSICVALSDRGDKLSAQADALGIVLAMAAGKVPT